MNKVDYKEEYAKLLGTGMFFEWFPNLTGNWNEDKDNFVELVKDWPCFNEQEK